MRMKSQNGLCAAARMHVNDQQEYQLLDLQSSQTIHHIIFIYIFVCIYEYIAVSLFQSRFLIRGTRSFCFPNEI